MFEDRSLAALFPTAALVSEPIDPEDHPASLLVDGRVREPALRDEWLPVYSRLGIRGGDDDIKPLLVGYQPEVGPDDVAEALAAAERAWDGGCGAWPSLDVEGRIAAVEKFSARLTTEAERVAELLVYEIGKPLLAARTEVSRSVEYIKATVIELRRIAVGPAYSGTIGATSHHARDTLHPLGKVLCVAPFNYPINELLTTIIPALLAGNVVIAKTPRFGVLANQLLAPAFAECFPAGVVALLPGDGRAVLPAVMAAKHVDVLGNPKGAIDVLAFIGSEQAANAILTAHPTPSFVHKILGLGAKNAAVVLPGADVPSVASKLVKGALGFNGQRCTAEKIIFAPDGPEGDALVAAIAAKVNALPLGMPWDIDAAITPLPEHDKLTMMWSYLDDALAHGARLANEGGGRGYFSIMRPAVVDRIATGMRLLHEEQFGPIVPIVRYAKLDDVQRWHRDSPYGQQAGVHGPDGSVRRGLVGVLGAFVARININDVCQRGPDTFGFTAADKSGFGTLSIEQALRTFSRAVTKQSPDPAAI